MSYTARLTITIPANFIEVGRAISRALEQCEAFCAGVTLL